MKTSRLVLLDISFNSPSLIEENLSSALNEDRILDAWREIRFGLNAADSDGNRDYGLDNRRAREARLFDLPGVTEQRFIDYVKANEAEIETYLRSINDSRRPTYDDILNDTPGHVGDGDAGNDTYLFAAGDGDTTISNHDTGTDRQDVLRFLAGIDPGDVVANRAGTNLLLTIQSTGEVITVQSYFNQDGHGAYSLKAIEFADGTNWDVDTVKGLVQQGTEGVDELYGYAGDDTLDGLGGNDSLYGAAGNDTLNGGDGRDRLYGDDGDDTLRGGAGNDYLSGGAGNDTYLFAAGDGNTTISNYDTDTDRQDVLRFLAGIDPGDVVTSRSDDSLLLTIQSTGEVITVQSYFHQDGDSADFLNAIGFADGTSWDADTVNGLVQETEGDDTLYIDGDAWISGRAGAGDDSLYGGNRMDAFFGDDGDDSLYGGNGDDRLSAGAGDASLYGGNGDDTLYGYDGDDSLYGGNGDDRLYGGSGNDRLSGDAGSDTYTFDTGFGTDTIFNYDTQADSVDVARFDNVSVEDLWFSRSGNNLQITLAGTDDQVTIDNWYSDTKYRLDSIEVGASVLLNNQVDQLVSAMAAYNVPNGAGNVIPQEVKDELQPVLAETWQTT